MKRVLAGVVMVLFSVLPSAANAGGWAVASLDPIPTVRSAESVDVGFRLLQHGRTPVVADEWAGATIGLGVRADGREWFVAATAEGEEGHYVATVAVPVDVSRLAVTVQMRNGLVVEERWADLEVQGRDTGVGVGRAATWLVPFLGLAAAGCAAAIVAEVRSTRRGGGLPATPAA